MKKQLCLALGVFAVLLAGTAGGETENPCDGLIGSHAAVTPVPGDRSWWMPRHQAILDRVAQGNVDLLMIGDSITQGWEQRGKAIWDKYYAPRNAVNMGFSGDRTEHVLWRLENGEIENIHPKLAVLMIGTNNSGGDRYSAEQMADGIKAIVCTLRTKLPDTKVLILHIFPRGDSEQQKDKEHGATYNARWAKNDKASELASKMADGKMIFYLDVNKTFLNEQGELPREIMHDLLHLLERGYLLWAEAMAPTLARLMGETK